MKKIAVFLLLAFFAKGLHAQIIDESTKKKFSIGWNLYSDIWQDMPKGIKARTINQGSGFFGMYNLAFGKSNFSFAIGAGLSSHNLYGNFLVGKRSDTTTFINIKDTYKDTIDYKRSKLSLTYLEIPLEFRYKNKGKFTMGIGFKGGRIINSHTKYVGENYQPGTGEGIRVKYRNVSYLNKYYYGPTIRFGYNWINVSAFYSLSTIFEKNHGPEMYPISVGITLMPF